MNQIFVNFIGIKVWITRIGIKSVIPNFMTVFLPCVLIFSSLAFGDIPSKFLDSDSMDMKVVSEKFINIRLGNPVGVAVLFPQINEGEGRGESFSKIAECYGLGVQVTDSASREVSDKPTESGCADGCNHCDLCGTHDEFPFLGVIIGLAISLPLFWFLTPYLDRFISYLHNVKHDPLGN